MRLQAAACLALLFALIPTSLAASPGRPVAPKACLEAQPGLSDLYRRVSEDPPLSTFSALLAIPGLSGKLKSSKPINVLAPTDQAFAEVQGLTDRLASPQGRPLLCKLIRFHLLPGRRRELYGGSSAKTLLKGESVRISVDKGAGWINDAALEGPRVWALNGYLYQLRQLMLPAGELG